MIYCRFIMCVSLFVLPFYFFFSFLPFFLFFPPPLVRWVDKFVCFFFFVCEFVCMITLYFKTSFLELPVPPPPPPRLPKGVTLNTIPK